MTTKKSGKPTLGDVIVSINGVKARVDGMQTQMDGMQTQMEGMQTQMDGMQTQISNINDQMVTKDEFSKAVNRLDSSIKREAGGLGESIHSLSNMVSDQLSGPKWRKYRLW